MPRYKCENKECPQCNLVVTEQSAKIVVKGYLIVDEMAPCPDCKQERITVKDDGFTTKIHGGQNIPLK